MRTVDIVRVAGVIVGAIALAVVAVMRVRRERWR